MIAKGTFEVELQPQADADCPAGRMLINKTYAGDLSGSGRGQMISKRTDDGTAIYYAVEEFVGAINGKNGAFTLIHSDLAKMSGSMTISQDSDGHFYELEYEL